MSRVDWSKAPSRAVCYANELFWEHDKDTGKMRFFVSDDVSRYHGSDMIEISSYKDFETRSLDWPSEQPIDIVGTNGGDGAHYNRNADEVLGRSIGVYSASNAPERTTSDLINKPKHYQLIGDLDAIDVIERVLTPEQFKGYLIGNFLKYRLRAGQKDDALQDLAKSEWYRQRAAGTNTN